MLVEDGSLILLWVAWYVAAAFTKKGKAEFQPCWLTDEQCNWTSPLVALSFHSSSAPMSVLKLRLMYTYCR